MGTVLIAGRWANTRTARLYIQTGLAEVVSLSSTAPQERMLQVFTPYLAQYMREDAADRK